MGDALAVRTAHAKTLLLRIVPSVCLSIDDPNPDEIGERVRRLLHVIVRRRDRERRGRHLDEPGDGLGPDELRAAVFGGATPPHLRFPRLTPACIPA